MSLTNEERLQKLKQAHDLIREVEFSYSEGTEVRRDYYRAIVNLFGFGGLLAQKMEELRKQIQFENHDPRKESRIREARKREEAQIRRGRRNERNLT